MDDSILLRASAVPSSSLAAFVAVAEELHVSRAAARLYLDQGHVSRLLQMLERAWQVQLLERSTRRVRITRAGDRLLPEAQRALHLLAGAPAAVLDLAGPLPAGRLIGPEPGAAG